MEARFKELSGGVSIDDLKNDPKFGGNQGKATAAMWKIINSRPDFWASLDPLPGSKQLWDTMKTLFGPPHPVPVVLTAGQGINLAKQKRDWFRKHIDGSVVDKRILISSAGAKKADYALKFPSNEYVTHILVDDTQRNIDAWQSRGDHFIGILHDHNNVQNTIRQLEAYASKD
jgi:hypothetical protein